MTLTDRTAARGAPGRRPSRHGCRACTSAASTTSQPPRPSAGSARRVPCCRSDGLGYPARAQATSAGCALSWGPCARAADVARVRVHPAPYSRAARCTRGSGGASSQACTCAGAGVYGPADDLQVPLSLSPVPSLQPPGLPFAMQPPKLLPRATAHPLPRPRSACLAALPQSPWPAFAVVQPTPFSAPAAPATRRWCTRAASTAWATASRRWARRTRASQPGGPVRRPRRCGEGVMRCGLMSSQGESPRAMRCPSTAAAGAAVALRFKRTHDSWRPRSEVCSLLTWLTGHARPTPAGAHGLRGVRATPLHAPARQPAARHARRRRHARSGRPVGWADLESKAKA
jgi:hypothetical protein